MFTAALFTIAGTWKDDWVKKLWYIYIMEYYSGIKRNAFESVLMRWMNVDPIIHSEVSQKEADIEMLTQIYIYVWNGSAGKESTCNAGDITDTDSIPGSGRPPGEGNDNPLQYSCLENPMDRGA